MNIKYFLLATAVCLASLSGCAIDMSKVEGDVSGPQKDWKASLEEMMPLLGHRNWIVIADMAYPLQSGEGIVTFYADQPYLEVLKTTVGMIDEYPHVFAHIYNDKELGFITEDMVKGIGQLKEGIKSAVGPEASSAPHEELISRLDEAGKLFTVVIIKTPLTVPYTTTFLELDCDYWDAARQKILDSKISGN
ncbi:MAG: hypothetical protein IJK05_06105 [Bacteroidales bacterium]|nr:hypothetical protein [Bacteroidales bacterium]